MDIAWVAREEGTIDYEDFAGAMGGGVEERSAGHLKCVLQGGVPLGLLGAETFELLDMLRGVAAHVTNAYSDTIAHADDTEL